MMRSLYAGISGLKNHQTRMDVIGNNIANVNTVGFKGSRVSFQDMLSQTLQGASGASGDRGGTNPVQIGMGMGVASIDTIFTDGSFQSTGKQNDLAISGQGFFVLSDGTNQVYTRAGGFDFDTTGNLLVPGTGYKVMGYKADGKGNIDASQALQNIQIPVGSSMAAKISSKVTYANNLMASAIAMGTAAVKAATNAALSAATAADTDAAATLATATTEDTNAGTALIAATAVDANAGMVLSAATAAEMNALATIATNTIADTNASTVSTATTNMLSKADTAVISATASATGPLTAALATAAQTDAAAVLAAATAALTLATPATLTALTQAKNDATAAKTAADTAVATLNLTTATAAKMAAITAQLSASLASTTATNAQAITTAVLAASITAETTTSAALTVASDAKIVTATDLIAPTTLKATTAAILAAATTAKTTTATAVTAATTAVTAANDKSSDALASIPVYDSQGNAYELNGIFEKNADNTWSFTPKTTVTNTAGVTTANVTVSAPIVIEFNVDGSFKQSTTSATITIDPTTVTPPSPYAGAGVFTITPDFSTMTQYGIATTVAATGQDGYTSGSLTKTSINTSGVIVGQFDNGQVLNLAQVALANFNNPSGLGKSGESLYVKTTNSGEPQVGVAGTGGRGSFNSSSLEMSNVDLAQQFSDMIVTQRGFQANSKIITTTDTMLEELVNLKR